MMRFLRTSLFALTVVLSACGSENATPVADSSVTEFTKIDACTLLTKQEIETHAGKVPGEPEPAMFGLIPTCTWPAADGSEPQILHVSVTRRGTSDYEGFFADQKAAWGENFSAEACPTRNPRV